VAQEDQPHHGHEIFVAGQLRVGAQSVGGFPQAFFDGFDMLELRHLSLVSFRYGMLPQSSNNSLFHPPVTATVANLP